jgi:hypothetical protein
MANHPVIKAYYDREDEYGAGCSNQTHFQAAEIQYHNRPRLAKFMTEQGFIELGMGRDVSR